ncbi:MAG TPA: KamA family radical SAM protein, partial [bacterium]|nr:KamA family radical SAM protein [bacterium]
MIQYLLDEFTHDNPTITSLIQEADTPYRARNFLKAYLDEFSRLLFKESQRDSSLAWSQQITCYLTFQEIISLRSERISRFSIIKRLWQAIHKRENSSDQPLSEAFYTDLGHILAGMTGKSTIYLSKELPDFLTMQGQEAANARSEELDWLAAHTLDSISRYAHGLQPEVIDRRAQNRARILSHFGGAEEEWQDYRWHLHHLVRDSATLSSLIDLTADESAAVDRARKARLPFGITPYYASLMDQEAHRIDDHAVRAQVIPPPFYVDTMLDHQNDKADYFDFMRETDTSPIELITRRYPHIAIFKPYNTCSQICVYCQRNWEIDDVLFPEALALPEKIDRAIAWLQEHPAITEVLVTGGDPLVMPDRVLAGILERLAAIAHIERIRIGSRIFVALPQRMTDDLADLIARFHQPGRREMAMVTHYEHPYEVTPESMESVQKMRRRGIAVYNQAVYTMENSRRFELVALRRLLRLIGVDAYYTFCTKGKDETRDYRVPIARLQQEVKEEARLMPGLVRTDEPVYNVPRLGKNYLRAEQ